MSDLIDRQAAIDALADMHCKSDEDGYVWIIRSDAWGRIDTLPSVQPERKKGTWEEIYDANENGEPYPCGAACSECGFLTNFETDFCPYCGADMRCGDTE